MAALVEVSGLRVTAANPGGAESDIVRDISFSIARGEVLALIGESGSGKTTIALTLLGYARRGCRIAGGSVRIGGDEVTTLSSGALSDLRGRRVAYVAQSAAAAFNPSLRLMDQVTEGVRMRGLMPRAAAETKAREIFRALALPEPDRIGARFPHQVSGGQLQRLMAAMALMTDPELVIFDEPTTALDVTTQVEVLRAFREAVRERHTTAVYVSHDLAVVAQIADRIVVLRDGTMREIGPTQQILAQPADNYTKSLLAAASPKPREAGDARLIGADLSALLPSFAGEVSPSYGDGGVMSPSPVAHDPSVREDADTSPAGLGRRAQKLAPMGARHPSRVFVDSGADRATSAAGAPPPVARPQPPLLEVRGLTAGYGPIDREGRVATPVLHDISLEISAGSALGVIGESGSGKSTLARVIAGLLPAASGSMTLDGVALAPMLEARGREELRRIQIVFQAADTALNPAHSVERILSRPLAFYHRLSRSEQRRRVRRLLDLVKLPVALLDRLPNELSGGQKQRVNLARALAAEPALILCDEVTSSLDTVVGAAILELLAELRRELGLALMFISHDLATVRAVCDEVMILYAGQVMERGPGRVVMQAPQHPYADLLASSMPELRPGWLDGIDAARLAEARGEAARPSHSDRCAFVARCATRNALCDTDPPPLRRFAKGSDVRCHRTEQELLAQQSARPDGAVVVPLQRLNHRA